MNLETEQPRTRYLEINDSLVGRIVACSELVDEPNDILRANDLFRIFPTLIKTEDSMTLRILTETLGERASNLDLGALSLEDIRIAQRDLSMWVTASTLALPHITSLDRNGKAVPDADLTVPKATAELIKLSEILDVSPRTTDKNWTGMNPRDFTDTRFVINGRSVKAESIIKVCVGENWDRQDETAKGLLKLSSARIDDPEFSTFIAKSKDDLSVLVPSIAVVKRDLTNEIPGMEYFMYDFMTKTKEVMVGGKKRFQSGSQFLPIQMNDAILGITNSENPDDLAYLEESLESGSQEQIAQFRQIQENIRKNGTLIEQVFANPKAKEGARAVLDMLNVIAQFRTAHEGAIRASKAYRPEGESSGGQLSMAEELQARSVMLRNLVGDFVRKAA